MLFLDELPEWDRRVLEVLREPLETGVVHVSRAARQSTFPAQFQLVAAMNPCPCGWLGDAQGRCRCTRDQVARYRARVSGPLVDRIDLALDVPSLPHEVLALRGDARAARDCAAGAVSARETSEAVRARVCAARELQAKRQGRPNARLAPADVERLCMPDAAGEGRLATAMARRALTARGYHRVLKVARTIADLAGTAAIGERHVTEALAYRHRPFDDGDAAPA